VSVVEEAFPGYNNVYIGNRALISASSSDTGEPFCFWYEYSNAGHLYASYSGSHRISIYTETSSIKTLDEIYLPKAAAVSDVTAAPTAENFNALLASLRAAGYLAT